MQMQQMQQAGVSVNQIVLFPGNINNINQLLVDTCHQSESSKLLAWVLFNKPQGNPFFLI